MTLENQKVEGTKVNDTTLTVTFANENVVFNDVAQDDSIGVYRISKSVKGFRDAKKNVVFPLSAYEKLNYQDTMLLVKIHNKLKFLELANQLAHENTVLLPTVMGSVAMIEMAIFNEAHERGLVVPDKKLLNTAGFHTP